MGLNLRNVELAATFAIALSAGCDKGPSAENCKELYFGSRPVEGACLDGKYKSVDDLRRDCAGQVVQQMEGCACDKVRGLIWTCVAKATEKRD